MDLHAPPQEAPTAASVPPVVAVIVTCDAGPWLEEVLTGVADQDYPDLSVLVIDAASGVDPTPRVAALLPGAYVRRLATNPGYGAAANEVLKVVEGASHLLFLHDDAAPEADVVRLMVEEAYRSNAGVVAPKLVEWDDPTRLLAVGMSADKSGLTVPFGRGELDQEQHDAVRDVFVAPGACTLVRADLFATLGGFDVDMTMFGEDLDLCWRAQVLGARVVVAPGARVRHLEATAAGRRPLRFGAEGEELRDRARPLQLRHRLRAVLKSYGLFHLVRVVPLIMTLALAETAYGLVAGRPKSSRDIVAAWRWNLGQLGGLRARRRSLRRQRVVKDSQVRRLQTPGSARILALVRGQLETERRSRGLAAAGKELAGSLRRGELRVTLLAWGTLATVLLIGSRELLGGRLPALGQFAPFPDGPMGFLRPFVSGWRAPGLGSEGSAPLAFGLLGLAGAALGGAMSLLQRMVVLGTLPVAVIGVYRLTRPFGSHRARLVAAVLYAANPLAYDALARGRWDGLVVGAAMPWILSRLLRATGLAPFGAGRQAGDDLPGDDLPDDAEPAGLSADASGAGSEPGRLRHQVLPAAMLLAIAAAFAPPVAGATLVAAAGLVAGGLVVGSLRGGLRALALALGGLAGAAALLLPWTLDLVGPEPGLASLVGMGRPVGEGPRLAELIRFQTGPFGAAPVGWALLVAAALPLIVGRGWRFGWAARLWVVALASWGVTWAGGRGWLGGSPPSPDVLLVPAAVALAVCAALGLVAFEMDLRGFRFGWRQVASVVAATASVTATVPMLSAAAGGRWRTPRHDFTGLLSWMPERRVDGAFRVLWVGQPEALPFDGWPLDGGLAYGTSRGGTPDATMLWPGSNMGATGLLADRLALARRGETTRLGRLLAPMAVRYLVLPARAAPIRERTADLGVPPDLAAALSAQIDLRRIDTDEALMVYENSAWGPGRAALSAEAAAASRLPGIEGARTAQLSSGTAVLPRQRGPGRFSGEVPGGSEIFLSETAAAGWELEAGGSTAARRKAFGWANAFSTTAGGAARLVYHTPPLRYAGLAGQLALWLAAFRALRRRGAAARRRERAALASACDHSRDGGS